MVLFYVGTVSDSDIRLRIFHAGLKQKNYIFQISPESTK